MAKHRLISYLGSTLDEQLYGVTPALFHELATLAWPVVEHYRGDLYHDAHWLDHFVSGYPSWKGAMDDVCTHFFYGVRQSGTSIGTDPRYVAINSDKMYEITLTNDDGKWDVEIEDITGDLSVLQHAAANPS